MYNYEDSDTALPRRKRRGAQAMTYESDKAKKARQKAENEAWEALNGPVTIRHKEDTR